MPARDWSPFALLLIDVQEDFWPAGMDGKFPRFKDSVARLLTLCRAEKLDVLHIRAQFRADGSDWMVRYRLLGSLPCIEGTPGVAALACARELPGEPVIFKHSYDSFCNPEVQAWLQEHGKRYVVVAGLVTAVCVLLTGASASQRGYLVAVVEDACADTGGAHDAVMARYPSVMEKITTDELLARHGKWQQDLARLAAMQAADPGRQGRSD